MMREKVELLIDEFVDEILSNSQFHHESGRKQYHPRYIAVSKFFNKLIFSFDQLPETDERHVRKMLAELHRYNYNSVHRKKLIFDREWLLRQFELKLFGNDEIFRRVYQEVKRQNGLQPGYEVDLSLDRQLEDLLTEFDELGVAFSQGDVWQIGENKFSIEGRFAQSDLWLLKVGNDKEIVRLRELLPLRLGDFHKIMCYGDVIKENSY